MNNFLAQHIIEQAIKRGITDFCVAPGSRNSPLVYALNLTKQAKVYYWSEERSAGFFAMGKIKATGKPVAVVTTSGTAAAELLPAAMSAHYLGLPLLMITADRPRRFRLTGAPQTAEQKGLFGCYVQFEKDLAHEEKFDLLEWKGSAPAHLNVCFEEPSEKECQKLFPFESIDVLFKETQERLSAENLEPFFQFSKEVKNPIVVIGSLPKSCREAAIEFLLKFNAPIYAEGTSHLREEERLKHLRIYKVDGIWSTAEKYHYPIDGILRLGEIPTARLWRDLEEAQGKIRVCSISELPFSGLSWGNVLNISFPQFFSFVKEKEFKNWGFYENWLKADLEFYEKLLMLFQEEPEAEPSLFFHLSRQFLNQSTVYLGNSLPIREWDLAASYTNKNFSMHASRGVNGIDGQISTFLGLCEANKDNWAIIGDLTALYDMAGPWILSQMSDCITNIVIINNGGGQIFSKIYSFPGFINAHQLSFGPFAEFWNLHYERWNRIPNQIERSSKHRLIEIVPDVHATTRFWNKFGKL